MKNGWASSGQKQNGIDGTSYEASLPRLLAHELGHACHATKGQMKLVSGFGNQGCWHRDDRYHNDEEYDVITGWENPIAKEMANDPTTRANTDGTDVETGTVRKDHG